MSQEQVEHGGAPDERQTAPKVSVGSKPEPTTAARDLSAEIALTVDKHPGDHVRCTHVSGNSYRCNWWAAEPPPSGRREMAALLVTSYRVRKSSFLRATTGPDGLKLLNLPS
jgi:hypothetical protein